MKPTAMRADTNFFDQLNPDYHAFLKSYTKEDLAGYKKPPSPPRETKKPQENGNGDKVYIPELEEENPNIELYYDFHMLTGHFTGNFSGLKILSCRGRA